MADLTSLPPLARFALRGTRPVLARAAAVLGLHVPAILRDATQGETALLALGPDEFWLLAPRAGHEALRATLDAALAGEPHAVVDISDRDIGFALAGQGVETLLASGCPLDLDLRAFPVGMVTRTLFHKATIVLRRVAPDAFHLHVWRSFAPYVEAMIAQARLDDG